MTNVERLPIFGETAPAYYAKNMQVIPLYEREKKPILKDWSRYAEEQIDDGSRSAWIEHYRYSNIGLVLGPLTGLIMIDIDIDDPQIFEAIMSVLPSSPWARRGKKGLMLAYKWSPIKTFRVKNASGETIVECLSTRTQCVLPPSIHPDTQKPYESNSNLWEVRESCNFLPENIEELLRTAITNAGVTLSHSGWSRVTEYISSGSRDTTLTELAGLFAYAVLRGERTLKEAIGMLRSYHADFTESVAGDQIDVEKHVTNLVKFLHRDVLDKGKVLPKGWDEGMTEEELKAVGCTLGEQETEWDFEQAKTYLHQQFEAFPEGKERSEAVEFVLKKISRSAQLSKIDEDRILRYIIDVGGLGVQMPTLRARLKELRTGTVKGNDHSEIARAVLKDLEQFNLVRFHSDRFWKWAGSHWIEFSKNMIKAKISENYGHLDACRKSSDINGILNVLSFICEQEIRKVEVKGVNFANGFLTTELKLLPHDPDYGMTYTLPFRYLPEEAGKFPLFSSFLGRAWSRDEDYVQKLDALQEAMCVTLFGLGAKFQRAMLLHGAPKTGKTQLLRIIESLVPAEARCAVSPDEWGDKFLPTQMFNRILNVCGELSEKKLIDGQRFKDIIDGSQISGQYKGGQIFTFKPTVTHWFASNHVPRTGDTSSGFLRRWLILNFAYPIADHEKKVDIGDLIVAEEREAITAWAAQAMPRLLQRNEYTIPASHKSLMTEIGNVNNSVKYFINESGKVRKEVQGGFVQETKLYQLYWAFCLGIGGVKPVQAVRFRAIMRELAIEMGFRLRITPTAGGGSDAIYDGIALA